MKIELDDGTERELSSEESLSLCEQGWNSYLRILKILDCCLDEKTVEKRKARWFANWDVY